MAKNWTTPSPPSSSGFGVGGVTTTSVMSRPELIVATGSIGVGFVTTASPTISSLSIITGVGSMSGIISGGGTYATSSATISSPPPKNFSSSGAISGGATTARPLIGRSKIVLTQ